jgi:hypothetical protein
MSMKVETIVRLNPEDCGLQHCIVRLHNSNIDSKRLDRNRFFRREALVVFNAENGARVLRYAMGTPGGISITKHAIALDYDAVDALGVKFKTAVDLELRRATTFEVYQWFWKHPDLNVRLSTRLGVVGGILGIMGFLVGLMPFLHL